MRKTLPLTHQQALLVNFFHLVKVYHPEATRVAFETTDQHRGHGFVAMHYMVEDSDDPHPFDEAIGDAVYLDIDWDGLMKENAQGYATLEVQPAAKYHVIKMFETTDMQDMMFEELFQSGWIIRDGIKKYIVGYVAAECLANKDKAGAKRYKAIDQWFIDRGAAPREVVLIHHGEFNPNIYKSLVTSDG